MNCYQWVFTMAAPLVVIIAGTTSCGIQSGSLKTVNGIPVSLPTLSVKGTKTVLPSVAWMWGKKSKYDTEHGDLPWYVTSINRTFPISLTWNTSTPPNMVHVILIRQLLKASQRLKSENIIYECGVNVSYPTNNGCTLSTRGTLSLRWHAKVVPPDSGIVIAALWVPTRPSGRSVPLDHQATWIARIR